MRFTLRRVERLRDAILDTRLIQNYKKYRADPVSYVHEILNVKYLSPDQIAVLNAISDPHARILVPSGNETGKSFIAACILSWHYDCFRPSFSVTTAPSASQVRDIVFRELRMLRKGDKNFAPKADFLADGPDHIIKGFTAKDATSFHGRHDQHVLVVFDEAEGIHQQFWEAAESFAHRWVCFYNPTQANSAAAIAERSGLWKIIRMNAVNHPNIVAALNDMPPPIPNAISLTRLISRLEKWTTPVRPGELPDERDIVVGNRRFRTSPVAEARILGQRPARPINSVFDNFMLESTNQRVDLRNDWVLQIGCDVARYGDDFTSIHARIGRCSIRHESYNGWSTKQIANRLREICDILAREYNREATQIPVVIDDTGVGGGVVDQSLGYNFIGLNSSSKSSDLSEYPNLRSQFIFDFQELLKHGLVDFTRLDQQHIHDIIEQLAVITYTMDSIGRRVVAPKQVIKAALRRSPDDADAVFLAYFNYPEVVELY